MAIRTRKKARHLEFTPEERAARERNRQYLHQHGQRFTRPRRRSIA